ncbi:MAG TPA: response regulator [Vicinamibacterales bacterium]|nr:response regulator [Vicinamibacterales bacterium]
MPLVLNVDDNPASRHVRREILRAAGIDVIDAASGEAALATLQAAQPDVVLLDVRLPDASGFDLCRRIKNDPDTADAYVLLISAEFRSDEDWAYGLESGADGFLRTPVDPAVLTRTVGTFFHRRQAERRLHEERQAVDAAIRRSEQNWRGIFEHAPYGIFQVSHDGRILIANDALARLLGYASREALAGVMMHAFTVDPEVTWPALVNRWTAAEPAPPVEATWRSRSGELALVELRGRRLDGAEAVYEVFASDLTVQRRLEHEFRQAQKMEAVGRLAGGIAHDFNNLLTAILGYADLAIDQAASTPMVRDLQEIRQAAQRAASLTQQLLAFSRRQVLTLRPVCLNGVIDGMQQMLGRIIGEDIHIEWSPGASLPHITADAVQLEQVLLNLAVNARDAMPCGGRLTIRTSVEVLRTGSFAGFATVPGTYVRLDVRDTGEGMDAATQARIFEPFFTTKVQGKGTGLGLSTVYGIVKQLSGYIDVSSSPGEGSTFSLFFPASAGAAVPAGAVEVPAAATAGGECVLLVEDEDVLRKLTRSVLARQGYQVIDAPGPAEAIAAAAERPGMIDLILTDVMMPHMRGWEMVDVLQRTQPQARVLYISGYVDEIETAGDRVRPLLAKPFKPRDLLAEIRRVLDRA